MIPLSSIFHPTNQNNKQQQDEEKNDQLSMLTKKQRYQKISSFSKRIEQKLIGLSLKYNQYYFFKFSPHFWGGGEEKENRILEEEEEVNHHQFQPIVQNQILYKPQEEEEEEEVKFDKYERRRRLFEGKVEDHPLNPSNQQQPHKEQISIIQQVIPTKSKLQDLRTQNVVYLK